MAAAASGRAAMRFPKKAFRFRLALPGLIGGYQAGYNWQLPNHVVLGIEADATFGSPVDQPRLAAAPYNATIDYANTVRGRAGYAFGRWLPYLTGGFAWGHSHVNLNDATGAVFAAPGKIQTGWTVGAGVEFAVSGNWTAKLEYDYVDLSRRMYDLSGFGLPDVNVDPSIHLVKLGLNYRFADLPWKPDAISDKTALPESDAWNLHAQTTFLPQTYPSFRSPYAGAGQPSRSFPDPGDLDRDGLRRRAAVAGRRVLFRS